MTYELRMLDLGSVRNDQSRVVQARAPGVHYWGTAFAYLLLGGEGPFLIDTGFRDTGVLERIGMIAKMGEEHKVENQLAAHGVRMDDIKAVIHTHLHIDHAGQTDKFPMTTPVVVNRRELEYSVSGLSGASYPPEDIKHIVDRLHHPGALRLLDVELTGKEYLAPGLWCEPAHAHTEGSMLVYVETPQGLACCCGDVIYHIQDQLVAPKVVLDHDVGLSGNYVMSRRAERAAVKRLLAGPRFICPSHDRPGVVENGKVIGRLYDSVPGETLPLDHFEKHAA